MSYIVRYFRCICVDPLVPMMAESKDYLPIRECPVVGPQRTGLRESNLLKKKNKGFVPFLIKPFKTLSGAQLLDPVVD